MSLGGAASVLTAAGLLAVVASAWHCRGPRELYEEQRGAVKGSKVGQDARRLQLVNTGFLRASCVSLAAAHVAGLTLLQASGSPGQVLASQVTGLVMTYGVVALMLWGMVMTVLPGLRTVVSQYTHSVAICTFVAFGLFCNFASRTGAVRNAAGVERVFFYNIFWLLEDAPLRSYHACLVALAGLHAITYVAERAPLYDTPVLQMGALLLFGILGVLVPRLTQWVVRYTTRPSQLPPLAYRGLALSTCLLQIGDMLLRNPGVSHSVQELAWGGNRWAQITVVFMPDPWPGQRYSYGLSTPLLVCVLSALLLGLLSSCAVAALCEAPSSDDKSLVRAASTVTTLGGLTDGASGTGEVRSVSEIPSSRTGTSTVPSSLAGLVSQSPAASHVLELLRGLSMRRRAALCLVAIMGCVQGVGLTYLAGCFLIQPTDMTMARTPLMLLNVLVALILQVVSLAYVLSSPVALSTTSPPEDDTPLLLPGSAMDSGQLYADVPPTGVLHTSSGGLAPGAVRLSKPGRWQLNSRLGSTSMDMGMNPNPLDCPPPALQPPGTPDHPGNSPRGDRGGNPDRRLLLARASDVASPAPPPLQASQSTVGEGAAVAGLREEERGPSREGSGGGGVALPDRLAALSHYQAFMQGLDEQPQVYSLGEFLQGSTTALQAVFPGVHHASFCLLNAPNAAATVAQTEGGGTTPTASVNMYTFLGEGSQRPPRLGVSVARSTMLYAVLHSCLPVFVPNIARYPVPFSDAQFMRYVLGVRSVACLPLLSSAGRVLGVLRLGFRLPHDWNEQEQSIAKQVALILGSSHIDASFEAAGVDQGTGGMDPNARWLPGPPPAPPPHVLAGQPGLNTVSFTALSRGDSRGPGGGLWWAQSGTFPQGSAGGGALLAHVHSGGSGGHGTLSGGQLLMPQQPHSPVRGPGYPAVELGLSGDMSQGAYSYQTPQDGSTLPAFPGMHGSQQLPSGDWAGLGGSITGTGSVGYPAPILASGASGGSAPMPVQLPPGWLTGPMGLHPQAFTVSPPNVGYLVPGARSAGQVLTGVGSGVLSSGYARTEGQLSSAQVAAGMALADSWRAFTHASASSFAGAPQSLQHAPGGTALGSGAGLPGEHSAGSGVPSAAGQASGSANEVRLLEVIGRGGFGSVYKAMWRGRMVAVKVLEHGHEFHGCTDAMSGASRKMDLHGRRAALLEGAMTSTINHPNVVATYDYRVVQLDPSVPSSSRTGARVASQETHIVMEWCDRGSLQDALEQGVFRVDKALRTPGACDVDMELVCMTLAEVAAAMSYLHTHRITHRDLKPKNVLLRSSNKDKRSFTAKVADFGLSQVLPDVNRSTQVSKHYSGTVTHMPPELIEDGKVYPQGDVYAFGIMMWEVFTGSSPYAHMAHPQIMVAVVTHNLRPRFPENCPDWYKSLAYKCWQKDPKTRPSFHEIASALSTHIADPSWQAVLTASATTSDTPASG